MSIITRRKIQIVLGVLWLLDGALQLQHQMFTSNFANNVIAPAAAGQPVAVSGIMHLAIRIFLLHPAIFNSLIAITQLGLGILILWKKTTKFGLLGSAGWGIFVWYVGEGLGGLASGHTILLMGAPGAAVVYVILAIAVLPNRSDKPDAQKPAYWLPIIWATIWFIGAIYQILPGQNTAADVSFMIYGNAQGAPGWLATLDTHVANVIHGISAQTESMASMHMNAIQMRLMSGQQNRGYWFIVLLIIIQVYIGLSVFIVGRFRTIAVSLGIILSLCFWFVGQSLGNYFSGLATDPNTGPLLILLGIAVLGCLEIKVSPLCRRVTHDLERLLT